MFLHKLADQLNAIFRKNEANLPVVMEGGDGLPFISNCETYLRDGVFIHDIVVCTRFDYNGLIGMAMPGQSVPRGAEVLGRVILMRPDNNHPLTPSLKPRAANYKSFP